jgi:hypothetical protein
MAANVKPVAMEEILQRLISVGWIEYDAEIAQLFPFPTDYDLVTKIFFWTRMSFFLSCFL